MIMPSLLLQKPSKDSKTKVHTKALERRLLQWTAEHLAEILKERETIPSSRKQAQPSKKFVEQMEKGNVGSAIKLATNNMRNGILPLTDTTLKLLKQKHLKCAPTAREVLLQINLKVFIESNSKISIQMQFAKLH